MLEPISNPDQDSFLSIREDLRKFGIDPDRAFDDLTSEVEYGTDPSQP